MKTTQTYNTDKATSTTHGLTTMKKALKALGSRAIDRRTSTGKALDAWRGELIADLGGKDAVSAQQVAVVDAAVRTKLLLDSVDAWLLKQKGALVNHRKRAVYPVVLQRQALSNDLVRYMQTLGLHRRAKPVQNLAALMATTTETATETAPAGPLNAELGAIPGDGGPAS